MPSLPATLPVMSALLAVALSAQHPAGLLTGMPLAGMQPTSLTATVGGEIMARIPAEAYRGLGEYVPPASYRIRGVLLNLTDVSLADGETFDLHLYLEDGQSNLPTIPVAAIPGTTAVVSVLGVNTPAGVASHEIPVLFSAPLDVPIGRDLFVSVALRTPGLGVAAIGGTSLPSLLGINLDPCGPALPVGASFAVLHDFGLLVEWGSGTAGWQMLIDLLVDGPSGVAVSSPYGNTVPTASMFSGLHPDVADPPHHTARHDVPGYLFRGNGSLPSGSPVFLLGSTDGFQGWPWLVVSPGNAVIHLSPASLFPLGFATTDSGGNALLMWPVAQSAALRGVGVSTQAFGFDLGAGLVRAGAAVRQQF